MEKYAAITDNGGGDNAIWHDVEGEKYSFQESVRDILTTGTKIVYHRGNKKADSPDIPNRMSNHSHYFGIATIGEVTKTPDGNLCAQIEDYQRFANPVDIHRVDGTTYESSYMRGVRKITADIYNEIVAASKKAPVPVIKKTGKGVKTAETLRVLQSSSTFCSGKFQIVTSSTGFWLYNTVSKIYYQLENIKPESGYTFRLLNNVAKGICFIKYGNGDIGFVESKPYGADYVSSINKKGRIQINM